MNNRPSVVFDPKGKDVPKPCRIQRIVILDDFGLFLPPSFEDAEAETSITAKPEDLS